MITIAYVLLLVAVSLLLGFHVGRIRRYTVFTLGFPVLRLRVTFRPFDNPASCYARHIAIELSSRLDSYNVFRLSFCLYFDRSYVGNFRVYFDTFPYLNHYGKGVMTTSIHLMLFRFNVDLFSQSNLFPGYYAKLARKRIAKDYAENVSTNVLAGVEREYSNVLDSQEPELGSGFLGKAKGSVSFPLLASVLFYAGLCFLIYTWLSLIPGYRFPW